MKTKLFLLATILSGFAIYLIFFVPKNELLSPLSSSPNPTSNTLAPTSYAIMGFAPYWNRNKITPESLTHITHYAYFNLHLNGDGTLYRQANRQEEDPGFTNYKRLLRGELNYANKPLILTFVPESQSALHNSLATEVSRSQTVSTIIGLVEESGASGVNIDYEPIGEVEPGLRHNFTLFIQELRSQLDSLLTISTYASVATRPRIWDLPALSPYTDYFVIMTYDYTLPSSQSAGPNSPLRGAGELFQHDIISNIAQISTLIPPRQILLGIPFYGYEWDTIDATKYSPVETRGSLASLERIQSMLDAQILELIWDRNSLTPYAIASQSGQVSQIYFENETSIRLKIEFVKSANLGGIAIWALGYEGSTPWLWPTLTNLHR